MADDRRALNACLRHENAIEWIAMMERQALQFLRMPQREGQLGKAIGRDRYVQRLCRR